MIMSDEVYVLPNGNFVTQNIDDINLTPNENFSGNVNTTINVISTDALSGAESFDSQSVDINVKPVADDYNIDAQGSGIEDAVIAMPISLSSSDSDGSESIVGDEVRVTLENGGELSVDNNSDSFIDNGDGTYTMSQADLSHLQFTGPENQHGTFNVSVDFNTQDSMFPTVALAVIFFWLRATLHF